MRPDFVFSTRGQSPAGARDRAHRKNDDHRNLKDVDGEERGNREPDHEAAFKVRQEVRISASQWARWTWFPAQQVREGGAWAEACAGSPPMSRP